MDSERGLVIFKETKLPGAFVIELEPFADERGSFARTFCDDEFVEHGLPAHFPQQNLSRNHRAGTLRGMHYNAAPYAEAKLVRVHNGAIYDQIVDLRPGSPTRFQSFGVELTARAYNALFVPAGFAHGFITLTDDADVYYLMSELYRPAAGRGIRYDDPRLGLSWPREVTVIAERDANYPDYVEGRDD
jgi:dTDP-4-dehydrorhamnose 3,5-epimerase